jgi:hypothetical protein
MKILINDAESSLQPEENETLGHVFMRLEDLFQQRAESVLAVSLDENLISADQQTVISDEQSSIYETLNVQVVPTRSLPIHTLKEFMPLLKEVAPSCEKAAIDFQSGNIVEALSHVDSLFQVWAVLFQALTDSASILDFQLVDIKVEDSDVAAYTKSLTASLNEIKEALGNKDYVSVADILEYEISPATAKWLVAIDVLVAFMEKILADEPAQQ